ncbi:MAG: peptidoglycan DD-metalloendopeptidase family protein [Dehalococcoidia bacterium]
MALIAIVTTIAGGVADVTSSSLTRANVGPVAEARAGYLKPATLLSTVPSLIARHEAEVAATTASPAPDPTAAEAAVATVNEARPSYFTYTIQPGDTMSSIAGSFGISESYLLWNNPEVSADPDLLFIGGTLLVPGVDGIVYNVTLGDTLNGIAEYYGVSVDTIVGYQANNLTTPDSLIDGMVLVLPGGVPPATPAPVIVTDPEPGVGGPVPAGADFDPTPEPEPPVASIGYVWPYYGPISTYFGEPRGSSYHKGIDIDGFGNYGAAIGAAASGTVVLATWDDWGLGYHVIIDHGDGSRTVYGHLSEIWVTQGQWVNQGETVGALGSTGYSTGPHLHFELWFGGTPVDPLAYLA